MTKKKATPRSDNTETPVAAAQSAAVEASPKEGVVVTRIAQIIADEQFDTGVSTVRIKDAYLAKFPRGKTDPDFGEREFAMICLDMLSKGYLLKENNLWTLTDSGRELYK